MVVTSIDQDHIRLSKNFLLCARQSLLFDCRTQRSYRPHEVVYINFDLAPLPARLVVKNLIEEQILTEHEQAIVNAFIDGKEA